MSLKSGAYALAIIDLFLDCIICMFFGVIIGVYGYNLSTIWLLSIFLLIWGNLLLLCGLHGDGCGFMIVTWQVIMLVYILLLLLLCYIVIPFFVLLLNNDLIFDNAKEMFNIHINFEIAPPNAMQLGAILVGMIVLPTYYIYFWILVNSHRKSLNKRRRRANRLEAAKEHNANMMHNQPFYIPPNYGNEAFNHNTPYPTNLYHDNVPQNILDSSTIIQPFQHHTFYDAQEMSNIQE